jgi:tellurite resistance protein
MNSVVIESPARTRQLDNLPIGLFGSVMGLTGLSIAWHLARAHFGAPAWIADAIGVVAIVAFVAIALGYTVKLLTAPDAVRAEFRHPIAGSLFGTLLISILLLPIVIAPVSLVLARVLWAIGAIAMNGFAWLIVSRWMSDRQQAAHATPAWIVPVVGLLDVPTFMPACIS